MANERITEGFVRDHFKNDGFEKRKHLGRIDARNRYTDLKDKFLYAYRNNDVVPGLSARQEVGVDDEWCAEAYMETDYSTLCENDFISTIKKYVAYKFLNDEEAVPTI